MPKHDLILLGHGARDVRWRQSMEAIAALIQQIEPDRKVILAFLEWMSPDLPTAVDQLVAAGTEAITVVPIFLGQGGHVRQDVPRLVHEAQARHAGLQLSTKPAVGEDFSVLLAIAKYCTQ